MIGSLRSRTIGAGVVGAALLLSACGASPSGGHPAVTTIVFASQGLGLEGQATAQAIKGFEKANPSIKVQMLTLSPSSNSAYQQLTQRFTAGSPTPDVVTTDVIWPATFAKAGWLMPLGRFNPNTGAFFSGQIKSGQYRGQQYAMPWFINAEGIYYRTDLIPTPPTTPAALVADAKAAMARDPSLKEGFAFEGAKYEGAVTALINFLGGFGGQLNLKDLASPANVQALTFMRDTITRYHITPAAALGWQEPNVQSAWLSGQAAFAMNWPYLFQLSEASGSSVRNKTGWIPFPSSTGTPQAALGGSDLAINAKTQHPRAAWKLIQWLTSPAVQTQRAVFAGDPPSVLAAYTPALYSKAPYFRQEKAVFKYATSRPVTPLYPQISSALQTAISAALSGQESPARALAGAQTAVNGIVSGSGG